jgi:hypothetical protein
MKDLGFKPCQSLNHNHSVFPHGRHIKPPIKDPRRASKKYILVSLKANRAVPNVSTLNLTTKIILALIALHLLVGFGWMIYKLSPRKEDNQDDQETGTSKD